MVGEWQLYELLSVSYTCPCVSPADFPASNFRARPKSAMQAVRLFFNNTFLLLMSLKERKTQEMSLQSSQTNTGVLIGDDLSTDVYVYGSVPVSDGGLVPVLVSWDVFVEVGEAAGCWLSDVAELVPGHHVGLQVVCQRALVNEKDREDGCQREEKTETLTLHSKMGM